MLRHFNWSKSKMSNHHVCGPFLLILLALSPRGQSWAWFSSSSDPHFDGSPSGHNKDFLKGSVSEYKVDPLHDPKAAKLLENARRKIEGMNPCWVTAYQELFSSCSQIIAAEEKRKRLAWHLSNCFQKDTGRSTFPSCSERSGMLDCLSKLNNDDRKTYLEFYLETNSICHQLQSVIFRSEVERLVNDLKYAAQNAEEKLDTIEQKSNSLVQNSDQILESMVSIDAQTNNIGHTLKNMLDYISVVLTHSKELSEQARDIAMSQGELLEGQGKLSEKLEDDMAKVQNSYENLGLEIESLKKKTVDVMKEINAVGEVMFSQMQNLEGKANDIASMAGMSIDQQEELLQKQSTALDGLKYLTTFFSEALQESRISLQEIANFSRGQQQELIQRQEQLLQANDRLATNSKMILEAQESFESKQANMFAAIDKLFALHNAMLLESRLIKAFFVYSMLILVIYLFTGTKQTYGARCKLYLGLCFSFAIECAILRFTTTEMEQQAVLRTLVKPLFGLYAVIQILHTIFTYRDYEAINHNILMTLMDKVNRMQKEKHIWDDDDDDLDSEVEWSSWAINELPEEVDIREDPDYILPATAEKIVDNSSVTSTARRYNLRLRH